MEENKSPEADLDLDLDDEDEDESSEEAQKQNASESEGKSSKTKRQAGVPRPRSAVSAVAQRVMKGTREVMHDLFKLKGANMKRNTSWKYKRPSVIEIEHAHIFHSVDANSLKPNKYCAPVGGHFHEVTVDWDNPRPDGSPTVHCGPPLQVVKTQLDDEVVSEILPVTFEVHEKLKRKGMRDIVDNHTHEVEYLDSEVLSSNAQNERRKEERAKIAGAMSGPVSRQALKSQEMQNNASKVSHVVKE